MGKLITYVAIMAMLVLLYNLTGLITDTPSSFFLRALLNPEEYQNFALPEQIALIVGGLSVTGIIIGSISPQRTQWLLTGAIALIYLGIAYEMILIFNQVRIVNEWAAIILISPFMLLFILSVFEWWLGKD